MEMGFANLVTNCTPSVPITHTSVDTLKQPRRSVAQEILESDVPSTSHIVSSFTHDCGSDNEC